MKVSENERVLENYKSDFAKMKKKYGEEIAQLQFNQSKHQDELDAAKIQLDFLQR